MKRLVYKLIAILRPYFMLMLVLLASVAAMAQRPKNIPHPEDSQPLVLDSIPKLLIYIGLPVFFFLLYLWVRRQKTKNKD